MLLRSSSTPVLGSLISSVPESPNNNHFHHHHHIETNPPNKHHLPPGPGHAKLSIHHHPAVLNPLPISCNSSPISPSLDAHKGFRRVQSDGNLEGLAYASHNDKMQDCPDNANSNRASKKPPTKVLQTIPSFSFFSSRGEREEEADEMMSDIEESDDDRSEKGNEKVVAVESSEYNNVDKVMNTALNHDKAIGAGPRNLGFGGKKGLIPQQMYLAKGLGIGSYTGGGKGGGSGGKGFNPADFGASGGGGGNKQDIEKHYKNMVEENPGNPLCLRNYAHYLYKTKHDLEGAEAYYSRAILADPTDGDILSQYAQLVWELNHDRDRALSYFEQAVHASPEDSHVQAAYANFLWETEEDEDECDLLQNFDDAPHLHIGTIASVAG